MPNEAVYEITVGGKNVTKQFDPILETLEIYDKSGDAASTAHIVLSDKDGRVLLPAVGDQVTIKLGWSSTGIADVFTGTVDEVRSLGGRRQGRTLVISAHGFDTQGKGKEQLEFHKDSASLQDFMSEAAGKAGLSFQAQGSIASIRRDYWAAATESFINLGMRVAREVGAQFKIVGDTAYMWPLNTAFEEVSSNGGSIRAAWGENLERWDIAPKLGRSVYSNARSRWYDPKTAKWQHWTVNDVMESVSGTGATNTRRETRADQDEAQQASSYDEAFIKREAGSGTVTIIGNPGARADGNCAVSGARPGIDGTYRIDGVRHRYARGGGFVTRLDLKQPQGSAGVDEREAPGP